MRRQVNTDPEIDLNTQEIYIDISYHEGSEIREFENTINDFRGLLHQEEDYIPCRDYINDIAEFDLPNKGYGVNEAWRRKLCEWSYEVVDHFGFDREVVSIALNYLDRAVAFELVSSNQLVSKRDFQLLAVTALYTAIKVHGETDDVGSNGRQKLKIGAYVELSQGIFQSETIEATERSLLFTLDWHMNPPTGLQFVVLLIRLIPSWKSLDYNSSHRRFCKAVFDVARYLIELSSCVSTFTFYSKNSVVAYASVICAIDALKETILLPRQIRKEFLHNVAIATGLLPVCKEVLEVQSMLLEICPTLQEHDVADIITSPDDGKSSPVCVGAAMDCNEGDCTPPSPKRSRSCSVEDSPKDSI